MNTQINPTLSLPIIGYHRSPLGQKFGIPRQPNLVNVKSQLVFISPFGQPEAFVGLEAYSHLWVFWHFHHNKPQTDFRPQVRPPRLGGNQKLGVFATRSMYRPSALGLSVVQLDRLEVQDGRVILHIIGADMVDGTPIVDVKPYLPYADSLNHAKSGEVQTPVTKPVLANEVFEPFVVDGLLSEQDCELITTLIAQDPRPAYRQHETDSHFAMRYKSLDVHFFMNAKYQLVIDNITMVK